MRRPRRTIKRESLALYRGRPLVLIVPPICDVIRIREKGRRTAFEIDLLSVYDLAARKAAAQLLEQRGRRAGKMP
ncbi:MAG TPA: hypothetical protein VNK67_13400 [Burkholderiales bacterium]|nr:hypothetical protein [Burkholderiales bacterium]